MARYRKKPVVVEAWQWHPVPSEDPDWKAVPEIPSWVLEAFNMEFPKVGSLFQRHNIHAGVRLEIGTLEGTMFAKPHDWIIRGVQGEIYACKPDIFEATYEAAD